MARRRCFWRDGASAKPLTVYAVNHPAMTYGHVGCAGFGGSGIYRRRNRKVPGCLKSESEERETWTAESLRAASPNGKLGRKRLGHLREVGRVMEETWRSTFTAYIAPVEQSVGVVDLVKTCDLPESILLQLESLILAQSERWRQA
jgi:hypothetical protein